MSFHSNLTQASVYFQGFEITPMLRKEKNKNKPKAVKPILAAQGVAKPEQRPPRNLQIGCRVPTWNRTEALLRLTAQKYYEQQLDINVVMNLLISHNVKLFFETCKSDTLNNGCQGIEAITHPSTYFCFLFTVYWLQLCWWIYYYIEQKQYIHLLPFTY